MKFSLRKIYPLQGLKKQKNRPYSLAELQEEVVKLTNAHNALYMYILRMQASGRILSEREAMERLCSKGIDYAKLKGL